MEEPTKKRVKKRKRRVRRKPVAQAAEAQPQAEERPQIINSSPTTPVVTKKYTKRAIMLAVAASMVVVGLVFFVLYIFTSSMVVGAPSVLMAIGGIFLFRYYWNKEDGLVQEKIGTKEQKQFDCLNIYPDRVAFEDWPKEGKPSGYPQECLNDHTHYYVNILLDAGQGLIPFVLPDQQYYDPNVFAERVLELPAHRRLFKRKEKLGQHIKTVFLVVVIIILWILILTTTGQGG